MKILNKQSKIQDWMAGTVVLEWRGRAGLCQCGDDMVSHGI